MEAVESRRASTGRCTRASATRGRGSSRADADLRARRRDPERRREGRDPRRPGRARRRRRGARGRGAARRGRREGAARPRRRARRPAVRDRLDRPARDAAELGADERLRHAADGRVELPVLRVPARGGPGARRADRHRRPHDRHPLPDGASTSSATRSETLRALLPLLERKDDRSWREQIEERGRGLVEADGASARMEDADPINPQRVFWELSPRLPDRCILTADSGSAANWFARDLRLREGMMASLSGNARDDGPRRARTRSPRSSRYPDRPAIALVGDGAMQMNGLAELITVAKYWRALERPAARRARAQQPRPQPGDVGAARAGGRPEVRGAASRSPTSPTRATPS